MDDFVTALVSIAEWIKNITVKIRRFIKKINKLISNLENFINNVIIANINKGLAYVDNLAKVAMAHILDGINSVLSTMEGWLDSALKWINDTYDSIVNKIKIRIIRSTLIKLGTPAYSPTLSDDSLKSMAESIPHPSITSSIPEFNLEIQMPSFDFGFLGTFSYIALPRIPLPPAIDPLEEDYNTYKLTCKKIGNKGENYHNTDDIYYDKEKSHGKNEEEIENKKAYLEQEINNAQEYEDIANEKYKTAKKEYETAKTSYEKAKDDYENAEKSYKNAKEAYKKAKKEHNSNPNDENITNKMNSAEANMNSAEANMNSAEDKMDAAEDEMDIAEDKMDAAEDEYERVKDAREDLQSDLEQLKKDTKNKNNEQKAEDSAKETKDTTPPASIISLSDASNGLLQSFETDTKTGVDEIKMSFINYNPEDQKQNKSVVRKRNSNANASDTNGQQNKTRSKPVRRKPEASDTDGQQNTQPEQTEQNKHDTSVVLNAEQPVETSSQNNKVTADNSNVDIDQINGNLPVVSREKQWYTNKSQLCDVNITLEDANEISPENLYLIGITIVNGKPIIDMEFNGDNIKYSSSIEDDLEELKELAKVDKDSHTETRDKAKNVNKKTGAVSYVDLSFERCDAKYISLHTEEFAECIKEDGWYILFFKEDMHTDTNRHKMGIICDKNNKPIKFQKRMDAKTGKEENSYANSSDKTEYVLSSPYRFKKFILEQSVKIVQDNNSSKSGNKTAESLLNSI